MDDHRHVDSHHYARTVRGQQRPSVAGRWIVDGLLDGCPECRRLWELLAGEQERLLASVRGLDETGPAADPHPNPLPEPPPRAHHVAELQDEVEWLRIHRERWKRDLRELRRTPLETRRVKVETARARFASHGLALLLLDESRRVVRTDPAEAENLASLVSLVLARTPGADRDPRTASLTARAEAHRANALRIAGDLLAAEEVFAKLRAAFVARPLENAGTEAEVAALEASLRFGQRHFVGAEDLISRAVLLYGQTDDREGEAQALIKGAMILHHLERPREALDWLERASDRLDPLRQRFLFTTTIVSRVVWLCDLGFPDQAEDLLAAQLDCFERLDDDYVGAVVRGLEGRIALGQGRYAEAERAYDDCRTAYLTLDRGYDAVLASLDLACVYLEAGRTAELRRLAAELIPTFRTRGVDREALAALGLLTRAVASEKVSRALLDRLRLKIEAVRRPSGFTTGARAANPRPK